MFNIICIIIGHFSLLVKWTAIQEKYSTEWISVIYYWSIIIMRGWKPVDTNRCSVFQWIVLLCIVIGFNWWMKPIIQSVSKLRATHTQSSRISKFLDFVFVDYMPSREQPRFAPAVLSEDTSSSEDSVILTKESSMTCDTKGSRLYSIAYRMSYINPIYIF